MSSTEATVVQADEHLLTVIRYVEWNPLRAELVSRAEMWPWSSAAARLGLSPRLAPLCDSPTPLPSEVGPWLNEPATTGELDRVRHSLEPGTPFGDARWQSATATRLGLEATLRPRGRPKKER